MARVDRGVRVARSVMGAAILLAHQRKNFLSCAALNTTISTTLNCTWQPIGAQVAISVILGPDAARLWRHRLCQLAKSALACPMSHKHLADLALPTLLNTAPHRGRGQHRTTRGVRFGMVGRPTRWLRHRSLGPFAPWADSNDFKDATKAAAAPRLTAAVSSFRTPRR